MCNKKDRSQDSFSRQIRLKKWNLVSVSIDGNGNTNETRNGSKQGLLNNPPPAKPVCNIV